MASPKGVSGTGEPFPEVNPTRELNLGVPEEFPVDPVSSQVETAKEAQQLKEEAEAREAAARAMAEAKKRDFAETLTSALLVSGVVIVAVGMALFVAKKLREA